MSYVVMPTLLTRSDDESILHQIIFRGYGVLAGQSSTPKLNSLCPLIFCRNIMLCLSNWQSPRAGTIPQMISQFCST